MSVVKSLDRRREDRQSALLCGLLECHDFQLLVGKKRLYSLSKRIDTRDAALIYYIWLGGKLIFLMFAVYFNLSPVL